MIVKKLYDSHVHLMMTGQTRLGLSLSSLIDYEDLQKLTLNEFAYRGDWIYGFGWDENHFRNLKLHRSELDRAFPGRPVFFMRVDGHSSWVNTEALRRLDLLNQQSEIFQNLKNFIDLDHQGLPTGVLREAAHMHVYTVLPTTSQSHAKNHLLSALQAFREEGFTHLRDMTSSADQIEAEVVLEKQKSLNMHIEHHFVYEKEMDLEKHVSEILRLKKEETRLVKIRGLKFFYDGSLGSETACLSSGYPSGSKGLLAFTDQEVKDILVATWGAGLDVSAHVIGDEAVHHLVYLARMVSASGLFGRLHLEHVQVLRPETLQLMKPLHIRCHLQPCHWLSDRKWLKKKLGPAYEWAFPWEALRRAQVPFSFGSDSPIEPASLFANLKALEISPKEGIPQLRTDNPLIYHSYPTNDSVETESIFEDNEIKSIIFDGEEIYSR